MSVIPLAEIKEKYYYEEIIGQEFLIPIQRGTEYTSLEDRNGYRNQFFSSNDMPKNIVAKCFGVTKYSADDKIHPVLYSMENMIEKFWLQGFTGYQYGPDELNLICKIFARNVGIREIRSIIDADILTILDTYEFDETKFWLASRKANLNFDYSYFFVSYFNDCIRDASMYVSNKHKDSSCYGVRPVFTLETEVKFPEPKINWVNL